MTKPKQDDINPGLIAQVNALAIGQSLTLDDGRMITCRIQNRPTACGSRCAFREMPDTVCNLILCTPWDRADKRCVFFQFTRKPADQPKLEDLES